MTACEVIFWCLLFLQYRRARGEVQKLPYAIAKAQHVALALAWILGVLYFLFVNVLAVIVIVESDVLLSYGSSADFRRYQGCLKLPSFRGATSLLIIAYNS